MKEEDAKLKWCPKAIAVVDAKGYSAGNRFGNDAKYKSECLCLGSGCMMWEQWPLVENNQYVKGPDGKVLMGTDGDCGLKSKDLDCGGAYWAKSTELQI